MNCRAFLFSCVIAVLTLSEASSKTLGVPVILQETPEWCFAASASMIFKYFGFPNLNAGGDFQCGVVAAQGGPCLTRCEACLNGGGTIQNVGAIMASYAAAARLTGYENPSVRLGRAGILSPEEIIAEIDSDGPILAGISPHSVSFPGSGISEHAVVIVGYEGGGDDFNVVINDPYPYPAPNPYVSAGGDQIEQGQYRLPYSTFRDVFHYGNSLYFHAVTVHRVVGTAETRKFCAIIAQYFIDAPQAFLDQRGKKISAHTWESNKPQPFSRCTISWAEHAGARYSMNCRFNEGATISEAAIWRKNMENNIDRCIELLPNKSDYSKETSTDGGGDDDKVTATSWDNNGDEADYSVVIREIVAPDGTAHNSMTVSYQHDR